MRIDVHTHVWPDRIAGVVLRSMVGVPAGTRTEEAIAYRERCIRRFARSVASTPQSPSGQLGTNPYTAVIVSVKCGGRTGRV